jgi:predicted GH43/DUF377 family glycosyl hydrolase
MKGSQKKEVFESVRHKRLFVVLVIVIVGAFLLRTGYPSTVYSYYRHRIYVILHPKPIPVPEPPIRRIEAHDSGVVFRHGLGPGDCDKFGAREAIIAEEDGVYHLFYDGLGMRGGLACLATSTDLIHWDRRGPVLDFGKPGEPDSAAACSPWVVFADGLWQMFYVGAAKAMPPPRCEALLPFVTMRATATQLEGPWVKRPDLPGLKPKLHTWYPRSASPGQVVKVHDTYLMFLSGVTDMGRTVGIARTRDLTKPWAIDRKPILPATEQIENTSLYRDSTGRWFLFTNHIASGGGSCDSLWVYWTDDIEYWDPRDKAIVLDGSNCIWSHRVIGMPTVIQVANRLAIFYDGEEPGSSARDIGAAWLDLPIRLPTVP